MGIINHHDTFKRLEVNEVRSLKVEPRAMIVIDPDENGTILDTVKNTRNPKDDQLDILNNVVSQVSLDLLVFLFLLLRMRG